MRLILACVLFATLAGPAAALPRDSQVGDGGAALPPCNSAWWGTTTVFQGRVWTCPKYGNHWVIV